MSKHPDKKITPGTAPAAYGGRDLSEFKALLIKLGPPSFEGSVRHKNLNWQDDALCDAVGRAYCQANPGEYAEAQAHTVACAAYWEMWEGCNY